MLNELLAALEGCRASQIVLTGAGRSFCSGLDLNEIEGATGAKEHLECLVGIYRQLISTSSLTVALVRGFAAGGGAGLFACARTVIASTDLRVMVPKGELATLASVVTPILDLKAGVARGQRWLGCELDADAAQELGLVNWIVSPEQMDDLLLKARSGELSPKLLDSPVFEKGAVARALLGLKTFLRKVE
jgi:enoyl-CoA hydratase/carnithine racemase